jgi:predicted permease
VGANRGNPEHRTSSQTRRVIRAARAWFVSRLRRRNDEPARRAEVEFHVSEPADGLSRQGQSDRAAQRQPRVDCESQTLYARGVHETRGWPTLADAASDIRIALRMARRQLGTTLVLILTLSVGIGATTTVFAMIEAVFLRPLPVKDPQQLVLFSGDDFGGSISTSPPPAGVWSVFSSDALQAFQKTTSVFTGIAAFAASYDTVTIRMPSAPAGKRVGVSLVSGNFFEVLGVSASLGRGLTDRDDALEAPPAVVVSDGFWRATLHGDRRALGSVIRLNQTAFTLVGVMPPTFFGVRIRQAPDLWVPLAWQPEIQLDRPARLRPNHYWLNLIGRLAPGQSIGSAQPAMTDVLRRFLLSTAGASPDISTLARIRRTDLALIRGGEGLSITRGRYFEPLTLMFAVVALLLVITCANVATLLLCRAEARRSEVAVRRALGARSGRLVRQWCTESLLLAAAGIVGGLALAQWSAGILRQYFYTGPVDATLNGRVLGFAIVTTVGACAVFGLAPVRYIGKIEELGALRSKTPRGRARRRLAGRNALLVSQVALSFVLVTGAALLSQTLVNLESEPLGFDQNNVLLMRINPRDAMYTPADVGILYRRIYDALARLPGIEHVSFASYSPLSGHTSLTGGTVEGYTPPLGAQLNLETVLVGPGYPEALGLTLVTGRAIGLEDRTGTERVAMVNETFAEEYVAGSSPIGHYLHFHDAYRIVGVIRNARFHTARDGAVPFVFLSMLQQSDQSALECELELRTHGDPMSLAPTVRQAVLGIDDRLAPGRPETLRTQVLNTFQPERASAQFVGALAVLGLIVAAVGLYGVVAHDVARRTREIAIRMSLGASRRTVIALMLAGIAAPVALGLSIGAALAVFLAEAIRSQLFGVGAANPFVLAVAAATFCLVAVVASIVPTSRVLRVSPTVALQAE